MPNVPQTTGARGAAGKTDYRELNITNAMSRCVHFTGLMGPGIERRETCAAGVNYDLVKLMHAPMPYKNRWDREYTASMSLPCFAAGTSGNLAGAVCDKRHTMTREEAEAEQQQREQDIRDMGIARSAIVAHVKATGANRGSIPCPTCKTGTLGYSRATSNGHVCARCSTGGCHAWME